MDYYGVLLGWILFRFGKNFAYQIAPLTLNMNTNQLFMRNYR